MLLHAHSPSIHLFITLVIRTDRAGLYTESYSGSVAVCNPLQMELPLLNFKLYKAGRPQLWNLHVNCQHSSSIYSRSTSGRHWKYKQRRRNQLGKPEITGARYTKTISDITLLINKTRTRIGSKLAGVAGGSGPPSVKQQS